MKFWEFRLSEIVLSAILGSNYLLSSCVRDMCNTFAKDLGLTRRLFINYFGKNIGPVAARSAGPVPTPLQT